MNFHSLGREHLGNYVNTFLAQIKEKLKMYSLANQYSFNVHLEQTYCGLLQRVYGWELRNQNVLQINTPAIDLAGTQPDPENPNQKLHICVQVTSQIDNGKIYTTLDAFFRHELDVETQERPAYDVLYILFAGDYTDKLHALDNHLKRGFKFDPEKHLIDHAKLYPKIMSLDDVDRISDICDYLQKELGKLELLQPPPKLPKPAHPSGDFIIGSRTDLIDQIESRIKKTGSDEQPDTLVVLCGPGGIGKSQIAYTVAWKCAEAPNSAPGPFLIEYIPSPYASGEDAMVASILNTEFDDRRCEETDLVKRKTEFDNRIRRIRDTLRGSIIVIDNFQLPGKNLEDLMQEQAYKDLRDTGAILIVTTRSVSQGKNFAIDIPSIAEDLMGSKVCTLCNRPIDPMTLEKLLKTVDCNSIMCVWIAKTLQRCQGVFEPEDLVSALERCDFSELELPAFLDERSGITAPLDAHIDRLYDLSQYQPHGAEHPDEQAKKKTAQEVLSLLLPIGAHSIHATAIFASMTKEQRMQFNVLIQGNWLQDKWIEGKGPFVSVYPLVRLSCRCHTSPTPELLRPVLTSMAVQYKKYEKKPDHQRGACQYHALCKPYCQNDPALLEQCREIMEASQKGGLCSICAQEKIQFCKMHQGS